MHLIRAKTFRDNLVYTVQVYKSKPSRQPGQDARDLPTYTIAEAALFLAIPSRTLHNWFSCGDHLLTPSGKVGNVPLLSFRDLSEAYVLEVLRSVYGFSLQSLKRVLQNARRESKLKRPLIEADLKVVFNNLVLDKPARGKLPRRSVDLAHHRNLVIPELVDIVGKRIAKDKQNVPTRLYPYRYLSEDEDSRPVSLEPEVMSGRLVIIGTRIPVEWLAGIQRSGKSPEYIATDYNLPLQTVQQALKHLDKKAA